MATVLEKVWTAEEFLALAEDGKDRWLIDGRLYEKPMTYRNRHHSKLMASISAALKAWRDQQSPPRGDVICGEAGVRLPDGDTIVGVDIAYVPPALVAQQSEDTTLIEGVPDLIVEILSPSDTVEDIHDKLKKYHAVQVPLVWVFDPYDRTVTVYRPHAQPAMLTENDELTAEPALPGFRVTMASLFA